MEARSLNELILLADNPPQYPESPAARVQESLVLYISRVPGTRDVILSTLKPQERNVTGEDVANSLYYVHLEPPEDPSQVKPTRRDADNGPRPLTIPRKPVPNQSGAPSLPVQPLAPAVSEITKLESSNIADGSCRKIGLPSERSDAALPVVLDQHGVVLPSNPRAAKGPTATKLHTGVPARKPVGARPMSEAYAADSKPTIAPTARWSTPLTQPLEDILAIGKDPIDQRSPVSPLDKPFQYHGGGASSTVQPSTDRPRAPDNRTSRSTSPRKRNNIPLTAENGTPFSLRIVRRNPNSNHQANVARVSSRQLETSESGDERDVALATASLHPSINVEISTSGYFHFRYVSRNNAALASASGVHRSANNDFVISRQLLMEYSQTLTKKLQKTYQRLEQTSLNKLNRYRSGSTGSLASVGSDVSDDAEVLVTDGPPPPGMKPRGYTFSSPWDGKCEFRTGQAGRSLICRHKPHDIGNNYMNPLVADQNMKAAASQGKLVSDLRFNLPASEIFAERGEQWKGNFGKFFKAGGGAGAGDSAFHGGNDNDHGDGSVSPFKLNLGTERAGGGARGREAKLGKLIVYDEGLKMLDLVVAANMGIWWRAWEKNF
ncbi:hypothetical protein E4U35_001300 [Claviceps purpurea]|nr:hypothetical protein E4U35_001300 [Claviceps purpurea]